MFDNYKDYFEKYCKKSEFTLKTTLFVIYYIISIFYLISGYPIEFLIISSLAFLLILGFSKNDLLLFFIVLFSWIVLKLNFNESLSFLIKI